MKQERWIKFTIASFVGVLTLLPGSAFGGNQSPIVSSPIEFRDVTAEAGISFVHNSGAFGSKYLPETLGPGVAFIDCDEDGWQDIFLVNGTNWPGQAEAGSRPALYHNNRNGTFTDITQAGGLSRGIYGMGAAVADFDNDGHDDLFVTAYGQSRLFRNQGNCRFEDVTTRAGLGGVDQLSSSAAWVDYDRDGHLDLVVANYVQWSPAIDMFCTVDGKTKSYCTPETYKGTSVRLWHNRGDGTFVDVTKEAGLYDESAKSLGVAIVDINKDSWPDIVISNDTRPNKLYINQKNGRFNEEAVLAGIAYNEDGIARAGMGVDAADYDHSGYAGLLLTNFSGQMVSLYQHEGTGGFVDAARRSEVGQNTMFTLGFGCFFFDYDLDGWEDIFVADGHLDPSVEAAQQRIRYAEPAHLFHNLGEGRFHEVTSLMGKSFSAPRVDRGAAFGDIDNDGDLDIVTTTNNGAANLFRNVGTTNHALRIKLVGSKSNRDGIGSVVVVQSGTMTQDLMLKSGSSYLSSNELILTFGLGSNNTVGAIQVYWPSGDIDRLTNVSADQIITIREGSGLVGASHLQKRL